MKYSLLISGGIQTDISFEEDFIKRYRTKCYAFDGSIDNLPNNNINIIFEKKNIGSENNSILTNLHDLLDKYTNLFVKMDIEGAEIPWIQSLESDHFDKIDQIAIEFHRSSIDKNTNIFDLLNKTHVLIHFHPNNCCGIRDHDGVLVPYVFECTYIHKRHFTTPPTLNKDPIPSNLDMKNWRDRPDIVLDFPPYVNK